MIMMVSLFCFTGCRKSPEDSDKIQVVCTTFPLYDWARELIGEDNPNVKLTLLLKNGVDMHSFQPTTEDIAAVSDCDVFIYVGGESDAWVEDVLKDAVNKDMVKINLLDCLGDNKRLEEHKEGMDEDHEEEEEEEEYDEHVWLSLRNAILFVEEIEKTMVALDGEQSSVYSRNANAYVKKLEELDGKYEDMVKKSTKDTIIVADRFPFLYLVEDYGIDYYAAFAGCSAETAASFETVVFLADKLDELKLYYLIIIDNSSTDLADTVIEAAKDKEHEVLVLDSIQSVTKDDINNGKTYLSVMENNLTVLEKALE